MTCENSELRMAELLAGEIRPDERAALETHLLECAACRADFESARAAARVAWPEEPVPIGAVEAVRSAVAAPVPAVRFLRRATGVAAALCVALLVLQSIRTPQIQEPVAGPPSRPPVLAYLQEASVGSLVAKDEDGRPVGDLALQSHSVSIEIQDGIAKTTVEENFRNHTDRRLEGTFHFPLPPDASISRLALEVNGKIEEGTCLERERAREVFETIVRKMMDPALLEWMPGGMFKCRVFPIEPRATKRVIVAYTQALPSFRGKMTYVYPLASEKTRLHPPEELRIEARARFSGRLTKVESPSHRSDIQRPDLHRAALSIEARNERPKSDFVLTLETEDDELRVVPHKVDGDDGYFALFVTPRVEAARRPQRTAFVLDLSASVSEPELEVARKVVRAMMDRRIDGDRFEILAHNLDVVSSGEVDRRAANEFLARLQPLGACDVLKALLAAPADAEIVYLGEGTPTFGETDPARILEAVRGRRIRTIGIGSEANTPLLERLGGHFRISPNDRVDRRVEEIAVTFGSPVISDLRVQGGDAVYDVVGLRDLFAGERLAVTGRYRGAAGRLVVEGRGFRRELDVSFPPKEEGNNYVRRLWAQRKVADLLSRGGAKDEVTALGVKHQIMTPYTSFLVLETEQMWEEFRLNREVQKQDEVLGAADGKADALLREATDLYARGKAQEAQGKFEEAFQLQPSSDRVHAHLKRLGEDAVGRMMSAPDRKIQDIGRRLLELARPGEPLREGKAVLETYLKELRSSEHEVWRNAFWHLKNFGRHSVPPLVHALADEQARARASLVLTELGDTASSGVAEALTSPDPVVRQHAAMILGNIKDDRSVSPLLRTLEDAGELPEVKKFAAEALRKITRIPVAADEDVRYSRLRETVLERDLHVGKAKVSESLVRPGEEGRKDLEEAMRRVARAQAEEIPREAATRGLPKDSYDQDVASHRDYLAALDRDNNHMSVGAPSKIPEAGKTLAGQGLEFTETVNVLVPGAPITDALPAAVPGFERFTLVAGGAFSGESLPTLGPLFRQDEPHVGNATRPTFAVEADQTVLVRQLEVKLAQMQELTARIEENRAKLSKSLNEKSLGGEGREFSRRHLERIQKDLAQLEEKQLELSRDQGTLEERERRLSTVGIKLDVAPRKPLYGKVTSVATDLSGVVISIGKEDGVLEGDEFSIFRGTEFVAKVVAERADRKWTAAKVTLKRRDPAVADDVSNSIVPQGRRSPVAAEVLAVTAAQEILLPDAGLVRGDLLAVTRERRFVAVVSVAGFADRRAVARVWKGMAVDRVLPGDRAETISDPKQFAATLPREAILEMASRAGLLAIRAKMRW